MALPTFLRPAARRARLLPRRLTASFRPFPDFVIIGAQKSGTSSLFAYLAEHPDVVASVKKEVHYFDMNYRRGPNWYRAHFPSEAEREVGGRHALSGEATPYYLFHPLAPQRLAATLPEARLVVLLRNPVDRAHSHYQHEVRFGREDLSFDEAIAAEPSRTAGERERLAGDNRYHSEEIRRHAYLARGRYAEQLEDWFAHFDQEQILILGTEAFHDEPEAVYSEVLRFLQLDDHQLNSYPRHLAGSYSDMRGETRAQLIEYFRPYNEKLYGMTNMRYNWQA